MRFSHGKVNAKMKKRNLLISGALAFAFGIGLLQIKQPLVKTNAAAGWDYSNPPASGEVAPDSYFGNAWHSDVGAKRLDDRAVMVTSTSEWGHRGKIVGDRKFDLSTFSISVELSNLLPQTGLMMMIGTPGSYATDGAFVSVDIIVGNQDKNYMVVVSNSTHNLAIPGFTDGKAWADDANFTGVSVDTTDDRIKLDFVKTSTDTTVITINDSEQYTYTVQNSDLFKNFGGQTSGCFAAGLFNNAGSVQNWVIESIGDATDVEYFSADGLFNTVRNKLQDLLTAKVGTIEEVLAAEDALNAIPYSQLYSYDRAYFADMYNSISNKISAAKEKLGDEIRIASFEKAVEQFKTLLEATEFDANAAVEVYKSILNMQEEYKEITFKGEYAGRYHFATEELNSLIPTFKTKISAVYDAKVADYETKVNSIVGYQTALSALEAKNNIPSSYNLYLEETVVEAFDARVAAANAIYDSKTKLDHPNWVQGSHLDVIKNAEEGLDFISYGSSMDQTPENSSGLFLQEKVHANAFDLSLDIHSLPESTGAWITLGILEKPEMWIFAEDDTVQENKGIFFLINKLNATTAKVQAFLCTLSSNRFYDSPLNQTINVPLGETLNISLKETKKTIAGLEDTYFEIFFNDISFEQEMIPARKLKTALSTKEGYFMIASNGYSSSDPAVFTINSINGKAPTAETVRRDDVFEAPTIKNGKVENGEFKADVNLQGAPLLKITVDGNELTTADYTIEGGKLTIKASYISTLTAGTHTVEITTKGGSASAGFLLTEQTPDTPDQPGGDTPDQPGGDTPSEPAPSGGCGGSIIAASIIVTLASAAGITGLAISKKKRK